jgi:hypothetical protein
MEKKEIKSYKYFAYATHPDRKFSNTVIQLFGEDGFIGIAYFSSSDEWLSPAKKFPSGTYYIPYRYESLPVIIDMLRNEKPVYVIYMGEHNSRISTTLEPIGEHEGMMEALDAA